MKKINWGFLTYLQATKLHNPACRKRRLNGAVIRNNCIKRVTPCWCLDVHVKEPYEMSIALGARP